ncbi:MAG: hypothetical protein LBG07_00010 [Treponema sp.]|nr:hypothetical protein [Treponema sp.]
MFDYTIEKGIFARAQSGDRPLLFLFVLGAFLRAGHAKTGLSLQFLDFTSGKVSGISALSLAQAKNKQPQVVY